MAGVGAALHTCAGCGGLSQVLVVVRLPQVLAVVGLSQVLAVVGLFLMLSVVGQSLVLAVVGLSQVLAVVGLSLVLAIVGLFQLIDNDFILKPSTNPLLKIEELTIKYELGKRRTHESDSQSNSMTQGIADFPVDLSHLDDGVPVGDGQHVSLKYP
ncbi:hypothetical protein O3P69_004328 [Scylla paramamosain]|uniref:Uncharacterized protein n=1 Tax=Scylla paramamosain TaxID=85552 RepID=A0AAW0UBL2_SCYPA